MTVCAILEKAQDIGFQVTVYDEGEFWTKRDMKALAEMVGQWDQMLAAMFGTIRMRHPRAFWNRQFRTEPISSIWG